jgi:hypothetical protein
MKPIRIFSTITITLLLVFMTSVAFAGSGAQKTFEELKALNGSWEGKAANGEPVQVSYRVTSNGSAVMSEIMGKEDMISMFNLDGDRLMITHYCSMGNQPRMVANPSADGKNIAFDYLDATNLASPDGGRMSRLVISMLDANHHTEEWVFNDHGKEMKESFDLWRKK